MSRTRAKRAGVELTLAAGGLPVAFAACGGAARRRTSSPTSATTGQDGEQVRQRAAEAYHAYQGCGLRAARGLFATGW